MDQDFPHCRMEYQKDSRGQQVLLKDGKFQVMMEWEKPYMHACIDALKPFGDVLEVGFGLAYSAERIQSYQPKSHTIVEFHPEIAACARKWAERRPGVKIVEDTWQKALARLGVFDCIFFDDYPLQSEEQIQKLQEDSAQSHLLLQKGKKLIEDVKSTFPFLEKIQYGDADLIALMDQIPLDTKQGALHFARFLTQLSHAGQITQGQLDAMFQRLISIKKLEQKQIERGFAN